MRHISLIFLFFTLILVACSAEIPTRVATAPPLLLSPPPTPPVLGELSSEGPPPVLTATATSTPPPLPTATLVPVANPDFVLAAALGVPAEIREMAGQLAYSDPQSFAWNEGTEAAEADLILALGQGTPLINWIYALAVPFATVTDETTSAEMMAGWQNGSNALGSLIVDSEVAQTMAALWGPSAESVTVVAPADLVEALWAQRPSWTIVPFQRLSPELKVLRLDGQSPLDPAFQATGYPLQVMVGLSGDSQGVARLQAGWPGPTSNRDSEKMTKVAMSGVTALGRATAYQMEIQGITTPGLVVGPVLQAADIAHVSHEVPFASDCPYPNPIGDPLFCARDGYLALIQSIGTDVVELTGNHVNDWGVENMVHSMELYEAAGMQTFGGGRNLAEAVEPALFEHNGNKVAFVGCNPVGPAYAWAGEASAGSRPCSFPAFYEEIGQLEQAGYLVIATLQYYEFYHYAATGEQISDFKALAEAGAAAVSGSQGHHAQGFDFQNGSFIHYGLGNLFFDQMELLGTRQSFIDTYTLYDGRLLSVELFTSLIDNYCCPRIMSPAERAQLLQVVFQASGW
jgi:poly-gamma-glutamate synthesis protein (capsule biosynthesis protein)